MDCIAAGTFGEVWTVSLDGVPQNMVMKIVFDKASMKTETKAEIAVLSLNESRFIPKLKYCGYSIDLRWCIIMESVNGGTLDYHIHEDRYSENLKLSNGKKFIAFEIALAIKYLHSLRRTHGDLKGNNVALTPDGHVKVFDFGHSRIVETPQILPPQSTWYAAPEISIKDQAGLPSDAWSYGILVARIFQGTYPFDAAYEEEVKFATHFCAPNLDGIAEEDIKEFIYECLKMNPAKRPSFANIENHEVFKAVGSQPTFIPGEAEFGSKEPAPRIGLPLQAVGHLFENALRLPPFPSPTPSDAEDE